MTGQPFQITSSTPEAFAENPWKRWRPQLEVLLVLLALIPIALFLAAGLGRLRSAFPLEQLEGSMLLTAERVAHGQPIYVRPNFTFIPYMYAPAYYYVSGWAVRLLGPRFLALRLVSLLSTCESMAVIYLFVFFDAPGVRRRRHLAALAGAALYAAAYPWTREWFDLGRLDSFYILLLLLALLSTRYLHPIFAAAMWTLAFLAKQTIFPVALIMLCVDWKRPRRLLLGVGSFLLMTAVCSRSLGHATNGWFWFYAFTVPHANADLWLRPAVFYVFSQWIAPFGVALLIIAMARVWTRPLLDNFRTRFYLLAGASLFGLCWFLQAHGGATANTPMPAYAILAVIFGVSFARLDALFAFNSREKARVFLLAAAAIPLVSWVYNPHDFMPHRDLIASQEDLTAWLRVFPGDVYLPAHPYEGVLAGKRWHPDNAALHDALRPDLPEVDNAVRAKIAEEVDQDKFDAIVLDGLPEDVLPSQPWLPGDLLQRYPIVGIVPGSDVSDTFGPHPTYFLLPCREKGLAMAHGWKLLETGGQSVCTSD
ncbi:MAG TPA: hypothetical protein VMF56_08100 [Acidobacteriaceae bacterium]|nr:hypothetical protein [Acidobacteriaceae bacterium]